MSQDVHSPRPFWQKYVSVLLIGSLLAGCSGVEEPKYLGDSDLKYYEDVATRLQHPNIEEEPLPETVMASNKPRTLGDRSRDEIWEMTLAEAIHLALSNNKIVRTRNEFLTQGNSVYTNPDGVNSVYDPAIRESGVLFGSRGVESALSAFDTQFFTRMFWNKNQSIQNSAFQLNGLSGGSVLASDQATFVTSLQKNFAYGATATVAQNWNYDSNNLPGRLFRSAYSGNVQMTYRQPLWSGAGSEFTHIAGALGDSIQGLSGVNQGVTIARINTDITLVDFEAQVRNMIKDVEDIYWDLYLAYRAYDSQVVARNSALRTWREVHAKFIIGAKGGGAADEAQSREAYFNARSNVENALGGTEPEGLYALEMRLRRICGLPVNDGRIIQPADEPVTAEFIPDWHISLAEAVTRREEIRRQKWNIKSLELQLTAARSLANPRLDFVSTAQVNGFGDNLIGNNNGTTQLNNAYSNLGTFNNTGYQVGFEFSVPLGLRNALSQVRNYELRVMKARDVLAQQELEISHEVANAFSQMSWRYTTAQTNFNRRRAAERQLQAFDAEYRAGTKTLDLLLQAQTRLATAEIAYFQSITAYNKALSELHLRKGTLLEHNNVHLAEGMWNPEAYKDALRKAWARSYAFDALEVDPLDTKPGVLEGQTVEDEGAVYGDDYQSNDSTPTGGIPQAVPGDVLPGADGLPTPENTPPANVPYSEQGAMGLDERKLDKNPAVESRGPSLAIPDGPVADRSGSKGGRIGKPTGGVPKPRNITDQPDPTPDQFPDTGVK